MDKKSKGFLVIDSPILVRAISLISLLISWHFNHSILKSVTGKAFDSGDINSGYFWCAWFIFFIPANMILAYSFFKPSFLIGRRFLNWYLILCVVSVSGFVFYFFYEVVEFFLYGP